MILVLAMMCAGGGITEEEQNEGVPFSWTVYWCGLRCP